VRIVLGIGILLAIFGISSIWHRSRMHDLRYPATERGSTVRAAEPRILPPGWGEVILGAPSGAEPVFVEPTRAPVGRGGSDRGYDGVGYGEPVEYEDLSPQALDWELPVRPGDVLSRIVRVHYGRVSPELERRLARYNGLTSPDKLAVGQTLYLPTEERLLEIE
jgi:hypothetical protein